MNDYEDAFFHTVGKDISQKTSIRSDHPYRVAIADGATESSFAAEWAGMLVHEFVNKPYTTVQEFQLRIQDLSRQWYLYLDTKELPWYAEEKMKTGAFSTILGIELNVREKISANTGSWSAFAIGDSCLFQVRNDKLHYTFPVGNSQDFNNSPVLISSNPERNTSVWSQIVFHTGEWKAGDEFYLLTDALAAWFMKEYEHGHQPWQKIMQFTEENENKEYFGKWIDLIRSNAQLKNDDVTCVIINV
jgi:hypothetical protein